MLLAAKIEEVKPPSADDFVYISDSSYTRQQIINMEMTICGVLSFHLQCVTPHQFLPRLLRASSASRLSLAPGKYFIRDEVLEVMVQYLLDLSLQSYDLVRQKPSLVAASAVYLARATLGRREALNIPLTKPTYRSLHMAIRENGGFWSDTLEYVTGYNVYDLEDTVLAIHELHSKAETSDLKSAFSIFRATKYKKIALRTVVPVHELAFP
jgi:cyclin A